LTEALRPRTVLDIGGGSWQIFDCTREIHLVHENETFNTELRSGQQG
jgi:hypothetical protein